MLERITLESLPADAETISVTDAGRILGITRMAVAKAVRDGLLPGVHVNNRLYVPVRALRRLLEESHAAEGLQPVRRWAR